LFTRPDPSRTSRTPPSADPPPQRRSLGDDGASATAYITPSSSPSKRLASSIASGSQFAAQAEGIATFVIGLGAAEVLAAAVIDSEPDGINPSEFLAAVAVAGGGP